MKTLFTLVLLFSMNTAERTVYICTSKNATAYHLDKNCEGLQKCKADITSVTETAARQKGLHLCGFED